MTLTEFLESRISEDEAVARAACEYLDPEWWEKAEHGRVYAGQWVQVVQAGEVESGSPESGLRYDALEHVARHDPARVLAECASKRAILVLHGQVGYPDMPICRRCDSSGPEAQCYPCDTLLALALPYADHPDYDEAWRP